MSEEKKEYKRLDRGVILVNTGNGKGKSTAAFGTAVRAFGSGLKPIIIQFIKSNKKTGEYKTMAMLGIEMHTLGLGFIWDRVHRHTEEEHFAQVRATFAFAREKAAAGEYDVMVLDEINNAMSLGALDPAEVVNWLQNEKPRNLHVILTGRDAPQAVVEAADIVTEMAVVKHHFDQGYVAVQGIEF